MAAHSGGAPYPLPRGGETEADRSEKARLAQALSRIDQLAAELTATEHARDAAWADVLRQQARISRIEALCDLAEWAGRVNGAEGACTVRVDDLRQALAQDEDAPTS